MPGLSKVIVLDPDMRATRQLQLGFEREGVPTAAVAVDPGQLELPADDAGLLVIGGVDGQALEIVRRARALLADRNLDAPIVFAGRGVGRSEIEAAGADEVVSQPAYLRDVVTIGRLLRGVPSGQRGHLVGNLVEITSVLTLVRAFAALGRSATLTLIRGLRRGEIRFFHGEVTSAQVGMIHGQAALHQLLLWTDARFDFHHEDVVRRQQIPLSRAELFADAERFLEGVRDSSGGLSPSVVLEQDLQRIQALGKQIPTEVYGVLRMFDGHRVLADVLEDSPYRVFETLRVAQRAVDAGLLRPVDEQPVRATWRTSTATEEWLIGNETRERGSDTGQIAAVSEPARDTAPTASRDARTRGGRKPRRKKKRRVQTPPAAPVGAPPASQIDWGALVPRVVGAEVTPLSGVVPSAQLSGEIIATPRPAADDRPAAEPSIVFDESAVLARDAEVRARAEAEAEAEEAPTSRMAAVAPIGETGEPGETGSPAQDEPAQVQDDLLLDDTKPERMLGRTSDAGAADIAIAEPAASVVGDVVPVDVSGATTERITAPPDTANLAHDVATTDTSGAITERITTPPVVDVDPAPPSADAEPTLLRRLEDEAAGEPGPAARDTPRDAAPAAIEDEPSDGVIREHIATADTAPVMRRRLPSDPPEDDRPEVASGEITMRVRPAVEPRRSEPTILVADLAAVHLAVSEIASDQITARAVDAASPALEAEIAELRGDAIAFSEAEEAFFRAGHEKEAVVTAPPIESFDDLDSDYQPVGFWDRLRGNPTASPDAPASPAPPAASPDALASLASPAPPTASPDAPASPAPPTASPDAPASPAADAIPDEPKPDE